MMNKAEIILKLSFLARQSEDAAKANDAGAACFKEEYETLCKETRFVDHKRMHEIYNYVVDWPRNAKRLRDEAELFREAVRFIEASSDENVKKEVIAWPDGCYDAASCERHNHCQYTGCVHADENLEAAILAAQFLRDII